MNNNGAISFQTAVSQFTPNPFPLNGSRIIIAPFWGDVDTTGTGDVWYHNSMNTSQLNRASTDIRNAFPAQAAAGFTATSLFIATWNRVGYFNSHTDLVSSNNSHLFVYCKVYIVSMHYITLLCILCCFRPTHFSVY